MIELYSGTPGSGKSLHIATRIYWGLRRGRKIVTNFCINTDKIKGIKDKSSYIYLDNMEMKPEVLMRIGREDIEQNGRKEDSILLVIDECQILFNSREWQAGGRAEWLSFFTQHRKFNYMICLVAQFDGMIDKQIRSLIEYEVKHRKVSNFGIVGKCFSILALGKLFVAVRMWYPLNEKLDSEWFMYHKRYSEIYDTYAEFEDPNAIDHSKAAAKK